MRLLTDNQQQQIADRIHETESSTDAEIVAVIAEQSDDYFFMSVLWAALSALFLPLPLIFFSDLSSVVIYFLQLLAFVFLTWLFRQEFIQFNLIPRQVKHWRSANMARRQFLEQNLHHTRNEIGLLIFVSEAEHYVEILADRGVSKYINDQEWQEIIDRLTAKIKSGEVLDGFLNSINECGALLEKHIPATEQKNELPNRLVML